MSTQVLCVTENHPPSSPYYPLESTIFSSGSDIENDKECESSESMFDISSNPSTLEEEKLVKCDVILNEEPPSQQDGKGTETKSKCCARCKAGKSLLMLTFRTLGNVTFGILNFAAQFSIGLLDFLIRVCMNEGVHNVLMVTLTVAVEVFVVMVFAVATILATIIINVDDAYRTRHEITADGELEKVACKRSERVEGTVIPVRVKISKTRSARRERAARRSSKSTKVNVRALECGEHVTEAEATSRDNCSNCVLEDFLKDSMTESQPSEGIDNEAKTSNQESEACAIQEEVNQPETCESESPKCGDTDKETKSVKSDANESLPLQDSDEPVINKQSTIYRNQLVTIQDNDKLLRKKNNHRAPTQLFMGRDFDDGADSKEPKEQNESFPSNDGNGNGGHSKDQTDKTDSIVPNPSPASNFDNVETESVCTSESSDCKSEIGNTPMSFVSTKRMFENNN